MQFLFLCNTPKSCASRICITFPQITEKILTKDIIHWLELITEILSFLQIFNVTKTTIQLFQYIWKSSKKKKKINKKIYIYILDTFWMFKGKLEIIHVTTYISLFLPYFNNCFYMFSTIYPCLSLLFSRFVFVFSSSFSCSSCYETQSTNCNA